MMANRVPAVGRIALTPMLNERGKLIGDFTMCRIAEDHFFLIGTYAAETYYMRWFERHMPASGVIGAAVRHGVRGAVGGGPAFARAAAEPGARRPVHRRLSLHVLQAHGGRHGAGAMSGGCPSPATWATRSG